MKYIAVYITIYLVIQGHG